MHEQKIALITGSSRGIGAAIATLFAQKGYAIVLCGRTKKDLDIHAEAIKKLSVECLSLQCDVTHIHDVKKVIHETYKHFGRVDILINNAGYAVYKPLLETTDDEYETTMNTNVRGIFFFCKEILPLMKKQRFGTIINVSSEAGKRGFQGLSVYCASKFAVIGLTESIAHEVSENVNVCTVCPGSVNTDMYRGLFHGEDYTTIDQPEDIAQRIWTIVERGVKNGESYTI